MASSFRGTTEVLLPLIARYLRGPLRAGAFCQVHGITRSQLMYWRRKYVASSSK